MRPVARSVAALLCFAGFSLGAQLYFPPANSGSWDTTDPSSLNWCSHKIDSLYHFLDSNNTKAFILLKDGKIVLEKYFDDHTVSSNWYWASAGKSLTALLTGIAQQEGYLNISDTTSTYLGEGWTDCTPAQEERITIRHQLSMTTGLDDGVADPHCTIDSCLSRKADAGTRWAYHNAPYTLLDQVMENATGQTLNAFMAQRLHILTGMDGLYISLGYNKVFVSTARSMARFGLLILNKGKWNGTPVLSDTAYFQDMVNSSQSLNPSYGYLWWLNGKGSYMIPQSQLVFPGSICPRAPDDMFAAMGKNGQFINVVPSENLVWIRMGDAPDNAPVSFLLNDEIWAYLNALECPSSSLHSYKDVPKVTVYPNPVRSSCTIELSPETRPEDAEIELSDLYGKTLITIHPQNLRTEIDMGMYGNGTYLINIRSGGTGVVKKVVK